MYVPLEIIQSEMKRIPTNIHRTVFSLIIINKAGGLVYQREFQPGLRKLSTNDYLVLAGTFHGCVFSPFYIPFLLYIPNVNNIMLYNFYTSYNEPPVTKRTPKKRQY